LRKRFTAHSTFGKQSVTLMQTIIQGLRSVPVSEWGFVFGLILVGAVLLQSVLVLASYTYRLFCQRRQVKLERQQLELNIRTAMAQLREAEQKQLTWNGYRKFRVSKKVLECHEVYSFYLSPHDSKPVPLFKPGQFLTFQLNLPGQPKPVVRCYSLSDSPHPEKSYRVTIKKACAPGDKAGIPHGLASTFFCETLKEGDIIDVKAPSGQFFLDLTKPDPVVLISGGVGITPMLSMMNAIIESGSNREVWFFFGARNGRDHIQKQYLDQVAANHKNIHIQVCYSAPAEGDVAGRDYHHASRVSVELFKSLLPSNNYRYYLCGPGPFMKSITDGLKEWGVPDEHVFFEAFGPATVKRVPSSQTERMLKTAVEQLKVTFSKSGKSTMWTPSLTSLLDLAEQNGVKVESGCRAGSCGSCLVAIKSGGVEYVGNHGAPPEDGSCLTCIARPKTDLVLDA
jgi:ferredoxin-NADP reductase